MKRFSLSILLALGLASYGKAQQIPNGDLEIWNPSTGGGQAQNWLTTDDVLIEKFGIPITTNTMTSTTSSYRGTYAARLETQNVPLIGPLPGYLILGTSLGNDSKVPGGLPFTSRPAAMQLHYKLSGANLTADSAMAAVLLTRTVNGNRQIIAQGHSVLAAAATYTLATVPLQYSSALSPDSIHIVIASGLSSVLTAGTTLYVDDITITNTLATARIDAAAASLTVYPNPSTNGLFTLEALQDPSLLRAAWTVHDVTGRMVLSEDGANTPSETRQVDLRGQPAGVYTLRLASPAGLVVRRLIIQ